MKHGIGAALALVLVLSGCGASGPANETFNESALTEGATSTISLRFWMENSGLMGEEIVRNAHFDDAGNNRIVFFYPPELAEKVKTLEQGGVYTLTFVYQRYDDLQKGTLVSIE